MVHDRAGDRVVLRLYAVDSDAPSALNRKSSDFTVKRKSARHPGKASNVAHGSEVQGDEARSKGGSACGAPLQSSAETTVLVSRTSRTRALNGHYAGVRPDRHGSLH